MKRRRSGFHLPTFLSKSLLTVKRGIHYDNNDYYYYYYYRLYYHFYY